jgi:hypothetical protein
VQRGSSRHVCFAHLIPPTEEEEAAVVEHFAEVQYYLYCEYNNHKWCLAAVKTHRSLTTDEYLIPDILKEARLAEKAGSGLCFIHSAAILSRVIFVPNGQIKKLVPIVGEAHVKPLFVSPNVDHCYEF